MLLDALESQRDSRIRIISRSKAGKRFAREDDVAGLTFAGIAAKYGEDQEVLVAGVVGIGAQGVGRLPETLLDRLDVFELGYSGIPRLSCFSLVVT